MFYSSFYYEKRSRYNEKRSRYYEKRSRYNDIIEWKNIMWMAVLRHRRFKLTDLLYDNNSRMSFKEPTNLRSGEIINNQIQLIELTTYEKQTPVLNEHNPDTT